MVSFEGEVSETTREMNLTRRKSIGLPSEGRTRKWRKFRNKLTVKELLRKRLVR